MAEDDVMDGLERLEREFPEWHIWRARREDDAPGDLMATRRRDLSKAELEAGLSCTLPVGFHGDLRKQLAEQAARERDLQGRGL